MSQDPARWSSRSGELSPDYEAALAAYRGEGPSEAQLSRMLEGLEGTAPALLAGWTGWKLGLACVVAGAALLGAIGLWPRSSQHAATTHEASGRAASPAPQSDPEQAPGAESGAMVEPALEPASATTAPPAAHRPGAKQGRRRADRVGAAPGNAAPVAVQDPLAELALLQRARRVLAQQPTRALELAEEHARHYPGGAFSEERELLAIESLAALSLHAEATRRGRAFRKQFAQSIHLKRIAELIER